MTVPSPAEAARLVQAGNKPAAEALCHYILTLQPAEGDAWNVLGFAAAVSSRPLEALHYFDRAVLLMPTAAGVRFNRGVARLGLGQMAAGITDLQQALVLEPEMGDSYAYLALAFAQVGDLKTALSCLAHALILRSRAADPLLRVAVLLQPQTQSEFIESAYRRVMELSPAAIEARINLGILLRRRGALHEAAHIYACIMSSYSERIEIYCNLGGLLLDLGRTDEALAICQRAVVLWPDHSDAHNALGHVLHHSGQLEEAAQCYRRSLSITPDHEMAINNFGILIQDSGGVNPNALKNIRRILDDSASDNETRFQTVATVVFSCIIDRLRGDFLRAHEPRVQAGPFRGMLYHRQGIEGCYLPKVLGTYEAALHPFLEMAITRQPDIILNIGAADGYYAVGMALRLPETQVFAHDIDPRAHRTALILGDRNGVSNRLIIDGEFRSHDFARFADQRTLLICDIEGGEFTLLDPFQAPALTGMDIIVELHEYAASPRVHTFLRRFLATHDITLCDSDVSITSVPEFLRPRSQIDQMLGMWEARPGPTPWAVMWTRFPPPSRTEIRKY